MSAVGAAALFYVYAILNGLTLSVVFLVYTKGSIASTFFVTAGTFGAMSAYGYVTKRDLTEHRQLHVHGPHRPDHRVGGELVPAAAR